MADQLHTLAEENTSLPAVMPSVALVLRRTQMTLGMLRDVVQESSPDYWYQQGKQRLQIEKWNEAHDLLKKCININKQHWQAILNLAVTQIIFKNTKVAAGLILWSYNYCYADLDDFIHELTPLQWSLILSGLESESSIKNETSIQVATALVLLVNRNYASSHAVINNLIDDDAYSVTVSRIEGSLWAEDNKYEKALNAYKRVLALDESNANAYCDLGRMESYIGNKSGAMYAFSEALRVAPNHMRAYHYRGSANVYYKKYRDALSDLDNAIDLLPNPLKPHHEMLFAQRGYARGENGDFDGALADWNKAIMLKPRAGYFKDRAIIKKRLGDTIGATSDLLKAENLSVK